VSRGPRILVPCFAVNVRFLLAVFEEGAGNVSIRLEDAYHLANTFDARQCFFKLREATGSDQTHLSHNVYNPV